MKKAICFATAVFAIFFSFNSNAQQYTFTNYTGNSMDIHLDSLFGDKWCEVLNLKPGKQKSCSFPCDSYAHFIKFKWHEDSVWSMPQAIGYKYGEDTGQDFGWNLGEDRDFALRPQDKGHIKVNKGDPTPKGYSCGGHKK